MEFFDASKKEESDGEETEDETEEEKLIELERRKFGARDTTATKATPADEKEEGKDDELRKDAIPAVNVVHATKTRSTDEKGDGTSLDAMHEVENAARDKEDKGSTDEDNGREDARPTTTVHALVESVLKKYEKRSEYTQKALEFTRKRGFGPTKRKRSLDDKEDEGDEEEEVHTDSDAEIEEEIVFLRQILKEKMNGDSNTSMNNPLNIPSSEEIMRVVDKKLGELNDASENANNKWAFAASAAAATEIFAAKKMEKAKCAFDDANRKAQIAAEKLQRAEKLLQVASVLETRQKPNGEELKASKIGMRKQRRALKQKLKNEFLLEMNRNGHDNSIDTASSSDDDDEAEDEKEDAQHLSNVTIEEGQGGEDVENGTKKNNKNAVPPHQLRDTKNSKEAPEPPSEYIQKVVWSSVDACHVCNEPLMDYCDINDQILICDGCDVQVHKSCYGVEKIPDGEWLCAGCEDGVSNLIENGRGMCALCPTPKGALARIKLKSKFSTNWRAPGYHAHVACALTLPEISFTKAVDNDKKASESGSSVLRIDASKLTSSRMTLKCEICGEEGACTQCAMKKCFKAFHPLCARGSQNAWLRRAGTGQPMVFCSTHSSERWLQKRRETCSLPIDSEVNDAYLTGGSVFWGPHNAAVRPAAQVFANATRETTEAIANEAHGNIDEKRLVNTGDGSMRVLNSTNDSHSAKDQLQQDNKMSLVQENPVRKILMNKPKKGKRGSLENITNGTIENIVPNAKSAIGRAMAILRSLNSKCMTLFSQPFLDEHMKSDVPIDSIRNVLKRTFGAFEVPGSQKYSEPWKTLTVAQRVIARDIIARHKFLGLAFAILRLPSGFGKRLTVISAMAIQGEKPHAIVCDNKVDALNWIADLAKFCPKLRQVSILSTADAKNTLKGTAIQKYSFDVLVITTDILFDVVMKHGMKLNADGTPVPAEYSALSPEALHRPFSSANFDGVDGFCKWIAHFDDATNKSRFKTKRVIVLPNDNDTFECEGENFRKMFRTVHARCGEVYTKESATNIWALRAQSLDYTLPTENNGAQEDDEVLFSMETTSAAEEEEVTFNEITDTKAREMLTTYFEKDSLLQDKFVEPHIMEMRESIVNTKGESTIVERMKDSFFDMEPQKISNGIQGAMRIARVIATRSFARTLFVYDDTKTTNFPITSFAEKDNYSVLDPLVKPFGARLIDAVEYRDIRKRTVGIVSLTGLKKASRLTLGTQVCVLYDIDAQAVTDIIHPKIAPCDTRAREDIPLVHLKSSSNEEETFVNSLEDTEEAIAEFMTNVVNECSPEVQLLSSPSIMEEADDATAKMNRPTCDLNTPFPKESHETFCFSCKSSKEGGCKAIPPAWLTPEVASIWLQCSKCPNAGSAGCAGVLTAPNPEEPWVCPSHKCAVCGDMCGASEKITLRCVECGFAYCDTCSSGAEFEKADKKEWSEKNGFVLPTHSEYVKCGVCCAAAKAPSAVVKKRKTNAATLVL